MHLSDRHLPQKATVNKCETRWAGASFCRLRCLNVLFIRHPPVSVTLENSGNRTPELPLKGIHAGKGTDEEGERGGGIKY
jgi:hypothetical protein